MKSAEEISQGRIEEVVQTLSRFNSSRYVLERYIASLQQLTIAIYPLEGGKGTYVTFRGVKYIQLPTYWQEVPFRLVTQSECIDFCRSNSLEIVEEIPYLFCVQLPSSRANIVFHSVRISELSPWDEERS